MSNNGKALTLYGDAAGPNPLKVAIVLEELGLEYNVVSVDMKSGEHKGPEYTKLNPNGRLPTLVDHSNGDFTIWESDAILLYLVEKYDKEHKFSVSDENEKFKLIQWLFFPSVRPRAVWFKLYHPEKVPSAVERYQKEILRVFSVLESVLSKQEWLVGGKLTIADLSFIPWNGVAIDFVFAGVEDFNIEKEYPSVYKWHKKLTQRPAIAKLLEIRDKHIKAAQLQASKQAEDKAQ